VAEKQDRAPPHLVRKRRPVALAYSVGLTQS
jgi:hypothetical protein